MLYREIIAVSSQIHTKHINTPCGQNVELLNVKLEVHIVTIGLQRVKQNDLTTDSQPGDVSTGRVPNGRRAACSADNAACSNKSTCWEGGEVSLYRMCRCVAVQCLSTKSTSKQKQEIPRLLSYETAFKTEITLQRVRRNVISRAARH